MSTHSSILKFHSSIKNRVISRESGWLEFKESFNWNSKDKYAKSMAAFANNKGGYLIFGVSNSPRDLTGLRNDNFENLDEAKITEYLNSVFAPEIIFEKYVHNIKRKKVGIIHVHESLNKPIVCLKNDGNLKEAEVYYRYNARSDKIKFPELNVLLEEIKKSEQRQWMDLFTKISQIGSSNVAILDTASGKIEGKSGVLVIDKELIPKLKFIQEGSFKETGTPTLKLIGDVLPVSLKGGKEISGFGKIRVTGDADAPLVRIEEDNILKEYSLDYYSLREILHDRYSNFKANEVFNQLMKNLKQDRKYCVSRYLDPGNPKSAKKAFYHPQILKEFDRHYSKKKK